MAGIPIYLRLKPFTGINQEKQTNNVKVLSSTEIEVSSSNELKLPKKIAHHSFTRIFDEDTSQLDLFNSLGAGLVENMLHGNDSSLFTVGPSGSGKSFSTLGSLSQPGLLMYSLHKIIKIVEAENSKSSPECGNSLMGILKKHYGPQLLCQKVLKEQSSDLSGKHYFVSLNIFELYSDNIVDLLNETASLSHKARSIKDISIDVKDGKLKPLGLKYATIMDMDHAQEVVNKAVMKRHVSSTEMNAVSSRSHIFIYINVHEVSCIKGDHEATIKTSRFTIADLAGSERLRGIASGSQRKEGNITNLSLSELGRVLLTISTLKKPIKESDKAVLRTSKLTRLLFADFFGDQNHQMAILVNIDPLANTNIISSVLRIIKPADSFSNHKSIKNQSATTSPSLAKVKIMKASTLHKPVSQLRLVQSPGTSTRSAITQSTQMTHPSQAKLVNSPKLSSSPTLVNTPQLHSPIKVDSTLTSPEKITNSPIKFAPSRSPSRLLRSPLKAANSELQLKVVALENEIGTLREQLATSEIYCAEKEFTVRQQVAEEYSRIIANIEINHRDLLNKFEDSNVRNTDQKIEILEKEMREEIEKLKQDNRDLLRENSKIVTDFEQLLFRHEMETKTLRELEPQINSFNNENIRLKHENEKLKRELESMKQQQAKENGKGVRKSYAIELDRLRESFLKEHDLTIQEYQNKISILADKLRVKSEKVKLLTGKLQSQEANTINSLE